MAVAPAALQDFLSLSERLVLLPLILELLVTRRSVLLRVHRSGGLLRDPVIGCYDFHLSLPVALGENLLQSCLEDTDIVIDDGFLLCRTVVTHDTD